MLLELLFVSLKASHEGQPDVSSECEHGRLTQEVSRLKELEQYNRCFLRARGPTLHFGFGPLCTPALNC